MRVSSDPAWPAKASGSSTREGAWLIFIATTTPTGTSAATAPLTLISAVRAAVRSTTPAIAEAGFSPVRSMMTWPIQVVTPVASRASLTTNSVAM